MENTETKNEIQVQGFTSTEIETLIDSGIIPKGTPLEQVKVFARVCKEKNLSPFSRQIYLITRNSKQGMRYTIQTGIDGYRVLADRTCQYAGNDDYLFDEGLTQFQMLKLKRKPIIAIATVYKIVGSLRVPFSASAEWNAYYPGGSNGFMWDKMPFLMLGKCAESLAMRKAFPETLSGIYTNEEMQQSDITEIEKPSTIIQQEQPPSNESGEPFDQKVFDRIMNIKDLKTYYLTLPTTEQTEYKHIFSDRKKTIEAEMKIELQAKLENAKKKGAKK